MKNKQEKEHTLECPWHKDWHSCNCGAFDFSPTKSIRSTHKTNCSWHTDKTICDCFLFSPLGLYVPYTPIQTTVIYKKETTQLPKKKYVKLIAKPDTWFKEGTEVYNYYSTLENIIYVSFEEYKEAKKYGFIDVRGWRISESLESEAVPDGEEYFDGETCDLDEFEVEIIEERV